MAADAGSVGGGARGGSLPTVRGTSEAEEDLSMDVNLPASAGPASPDAVLPARKRPRLASAGGGDDGKAGGAGARVGVGGVGAAAGASAAAAAADGGASEAWGGAAAGQGDDVPTPPVAAGAPEREAHLLMRLVDDFLCAAAANPPVRNQKDDVISTAVDYNYIKMTSYLRP